MSHKRIPEDAKPSIVRDEPWLLTQREWVEKQILKHQANNSTHMANWLLEYEEIKYQKLTAEISLLVVLALDLVTATTFACVLLSDVEAWVDQIYINIANVLLALLVIATPLLLISYDTHRRRLKKHTKTLREIMKYMGMSEKEAINNIAKSNVLPDKPPTGN